MELHKRVELKSGAWFGDKIIKLDFPNSWDIKIIGNDILAELNAEQIIKGIRNPIGSKNLSDIIFKKHRIAIVIDDITRPTPTDRLVPMLINELKKAGAKHESISVIIAGGTHSKATKQDIEKKLGKQIAASTNVSAHDPNQDIMYLGNASRGTPIYVNKKVVDSDVIIGVGCIYPHPAAGFSGGSKIIAPGVCGSETARYLHDYIKGNKRGRVLKNSELKREMDEIASRVGLDFIINVVLNQNREIAGLFSGDKIMAHREGIKFAEKAFTIEREKDADITIIDVYPFDMDFQFAHDRGLWLLEGLRKDISKIIIASCYKGLGGHDLYPVNRPLTARLSRRIKNLQIKDFRFLISKILAIKRILFLKKQRMIIYSTGLSDSELKAVFPKARLFNTWEKIIQELISRHNNTPAKVALYRCSPFLLTNK